MDQRMFRQFSLKILVFWFSIVLICCAEAQTPSLSLLGGSGAPGESVTLTVGITYNGGTRPAAVQWDLNYSTADLAVGNGIFFSTGAAASAAGKSVTCRTPQPGNVRCIVWGLNKASIGDGALALVTFQISATTRNSSTTVSFVGTLGTDRTGQADNIIGSRGSVTIVQPISSLKLNRIPVCMGVMGDIDARCFIVGLPASRMATPWTVIDGSRTILTVDRSCSAL
jgi:hypothetical protein